MADYSTGTGTRPYAVGLLFHPTRSTTTSTYSVLRWSAANGVDVVARATDRSRLEQDRDSGPQDGAVLPPVRYVGDDEFALAVDGVVSLGGDGTMLGAMRLVASRPVPVLGVNHGGLGFLVELDPVELDAALEQLVSGDFTVEPHRGLQVELTGAGSSENGALEPSVAFNDVVLTRRTPVTGISVDLAVGGEQYGYYRCDALVVATSTGSTAYNYAAGGPVLSPSVAGTVITPVAPMSGISRPVVLSADDVVTLRAGGDDAQALGPIVVVVDGVPAGVAGPEQAVVVRGLPSPGQVVRLDVSAHGRRSMLKLSLLDLPLRRDQLEELVPPRLRRHLGTDGAPG